MYVLSDKKIPQDEHLQSRVWVDPAITEIDVETVTAGGGGPIDDGFLTS